MANFLNLTKTSPRVSGLTQGISMSLRSTFLLALTVFASSSSHKQHLSTQSVLQQCNSSKLARI